MGDFGSKQRMKFFLAFFKNILRGETLNFSCCFSFLELDVRKVKKMLAPNSIKNNLIFVGPNINICAATEQKYFGQIFFRT